MDGDNSQSEYICNPKMFHWHVCKFIVCGCLPSCNPWQHDWMPFQCWYLNGISLPTGLLALPCVWRNNHVTGSK
jgi:hypothetical protein